MIPNPEDIEAWGRMLAEAYTARGSMYARKNVQLRIPLAVGGASSALLADLGRWHHTRRIRIGKPAVLLCSHAETICWLSTMMRPHIEQPQRLQALIALEQLASVLARTKRVNARWRAEREAEVRLLNHMAIQATRWHPDVLVTQCNEEPAP